MKVASLFIAVIALSSCVAKPWMVGSVNDQYGPPKLKGSTADLTVGPAAQGSSCHSCCKPGKKPLLNPVNHTSSHPLR